MLRVDQRSGQEVNKALFEVLYQLLQLLDTNTNSLWFVYVADKL